jgi:hypothetical protein
MDQALPQSRQNLLIDCEQNEERGEGHWEKALTIIGNPSLCGLLFAA